MKLVNPLFTHLILFFFLFFLVFFFSVIFFLKCSLENILRAIIIMSANHTATYHQTTNIFLMFRYIHHFQFSAQMQVEKCSGEYSPFYSWSLQCPRDIWFLKPKATPSCFLLSWYYKLLDFLYWFDEIRYFRYSTYAYSMFRDLKNQWSL